MNNRSERQKNIQVFPIIHKSMDKGYDFAHKFDPKLADLLKQIFIILMRPVIAFRAKLYRSILWPFKKMEYGKIPIFRMILLGMGCYLIFCKNVSFSINMGESMALVNQTSEIGIFDFENWKDEKPIARKVNEYAPVDDKKLEEFSPKTYVERFKDMARTEMEKYGIPASITLAQGLIESRAGNSKLAVQNNNHFGVKCFSKKCTKGHCTNHFDDNHKDFFRKYNSVWESYRDHSKLLQKNRYKKLKTYGKDYKKWARGLKEAGYATDKKYDKKLIAVIQKYKLYKYDK